MYDEEAMDNGDPRASGVGRMTTPGKVSGSRDRAVDGPGGITAWAGRGAAVHDVNAGRPYAGMGRITTRGRVTDSELDAGEADGIDPSLGITVEPDRAGSRRAAASARTRTRASELSHELTGVTTGPDGAIWFTYGNSIGRLRIVSSG